MQQSNVMVAQNMTTHEIEYHGWFSRSTASRAAHREHRPAQAGRRETLWFWSPRGLQDRGLTASREQERAYADLQAAFAASDRRH